MGAQEILKAVSAIPWVLLSLVAMEGLIYLIHLNLGKTYTGKDLYIETRQLTYKMSLPLILVIVALYLISQESTWLEGLVVACLFIGHLFLIPQVVGLLWKE